MRGRRGRDEAEDREEPRVVSGQRGPSPWHDMRWIAGNQLMRLADAAGKQAFYVRNTADENVFVVDSQGNVQVGVQGGELLAVEDTVGIRMYANDVKQIEIQSGGTVYVGDQANEHVKISATGVQMYDYATLLATFGTSITLYDTGGADRVVVSTSGVTVGDASEGEYIQVDPTDGVAVVFGWCSEGGHRPGRGALRWRPGQ